MNIVPKIKNDFAANQMVSVLVICIQEKGGYEGLLLKSIIKELKEHNDPDILEENYMKLFPLIKQYLM